MGSIVPRGDKLADPTLANDLADCLSQLNAIDVDVKDLLAGINEKQFHWSPAVSRWSIEQCLAHLVLVTETFLPVIDEAIQNARADRLLGHGPFHYGFLERWFVRSTEPPPGIRLRTPKWARPSDDEPLANVITELISMHQDLRQRVRASNGLDLAGTKLHSPFMKALKLSLGQCFAFLIAHERRHLWQAWQVRQHEQFPATGSAN